MQQLHMSVCGECDLLRGDLLPHSSGKSAIVSLQLYLQICRKTQDYIAITVSSAVDPTN